MVSSVLSSATVSSAVVSTGASVSFSGSSASVSSSASAAGASPAASALVLTRNTFFAEMDALALPQCHLVKLIGSL